MAATRRLPLVCFGLCLAILVPLQRWIDASSEQARIEEERLYFTNGTSIRNVAFGYEALLADVYWMRIVQYFGRKVLDDPSVLNQRGDQLALLGPLTEIITDLDPRYTQAYRFGGFFVHDYVDPVKGFAILEKGIRNNPNVWRLYQDLAFLYWTDGRCREASETYRRGARIPDAPGWMASLAVTALSDCGDIGAARQMLLHMLDESTDPRIADDVRRRLRELQALENVTALRAAVAAFKAQTGQFPASLAQVRQLAASHPAGTPLVFNQQGLPLDPNGTPYRYNPATGEVTTDPESVRLPTGVMRRKAGG